MPSTALLMQQASSRRKRWGQDKIWENNIVFTQNYNFETVVDGPTSINFYRGMTINSGSTVTTNLRNKGLLLFVDGDCIIDGTLSMTARGAKSVGDNLAIDYRNCQLLVNPPDFNTYEYTISSTGGSGGLAVTAYSSTSTANYKTGNTGSTIINSCGGGGSGGAMANWGGRVYSGAGSAGTSYSGGSGGGGVATDANSFTGYSGAADGGAGGNGRAVRNGSTQRFAGGGAGNPGGAVGRSNSSDGTDGSTGTGGLLILVVNGNLTIGSTGLISSDGSNGGKGMGGGGASGGGCIVILYTGDYNNLGTIRANGGSPYPYGSGLGGYGGVGSVRVQKISV